MVVVVFISSFSLYATVVLAKTIAVTNGETQGSWQALQMCPNGSRAVGYSTQNNLVGLA